MTAISTQFACRSWRRVSRAVSGWIAVAKGTPICRPTLSLLSLLSLAGCEAYGKPTEPGNSSAQAEFHRNVEPILQEFCSDCHAEGMRKGNVAFDELKSDASLLENHDLWWKALKNLRSGTMPPAKKTQPSLEQKTQVENWIKSAVFRVDALNPDPGRVTVRRLNRVEYRNTIRDLLGTDFDTATEFPPDDTGYGFDTIGDVLTVSPMLLEKYVNAAKSVISKSVPVVPRVPAEKKIDGRSFRQGDLDLGANSETNQGPLSLSYYDATIASNVFNADVAGRYQLVLNLTANEKFVDNQFDYNKCRSVFKVDGRESHSAEYNREGGKSFRYESDHEWAAGGHELQIELQPLTPDQKRVRSLTLRIDFVTVRGPLEEKYWVRPKNYDRFFSKDVPGTAEGRRAYAREILEPFVQKAYRRSVEANTIERLVALAESTYIQPGKTFEAGVAQAMVGILASPRFLFREERSTAMDAGRKYPLVDEFSLASRLSYFLWTSMPDDELLRLAENGELRKFLPTQVKRMLADKRSDGLTRNFVGQWLQARDIESVSIDSRQVLAREAIPDPDFESRRVRFRQLRDKPDANLTPEENKEMAEFRAMFAKRSSTPLRAELNGDLRRAMRQETEKTFEYILREDRDLLEFLNSDYTFLNERLAKHYGLTHLHVLGEELRRVTLPINSPRGGILTHGTVLAVTSNPTRTSPVKRGLFVLDNILGSPIPPPPPDIPALEDAAKSVKERTPSLRETLALHRDKPLCSSCHDRMDPLGLALDNFNAMGMWRDQERSEPIDATGKLITGEVFKNVQELKNILASDHSLEFYRTITEKLLTYAIGRGLEYYDVQTVDEIVGRIVMSKGRPSALLSGIIESAAFQRTRGLDSGEPLQRIGTAKERTEAKLHP